MRRAGSYRHRVKFEAEQEIASEGGGRTTEWVEHTTESCNIERLQSFRSDVERVLSGGNSANPIVRIHIMSHAKTRSITNAMRVLDLVTGVYMNVTTAPQDLEGKGRELVVTATVGLPT